jgi:hypothetical protein
MTILESTKLNQEVFKNIKITSHENMIMKSQEKFYENPDNISLFIPIVNSESIISIRLIDHFVTKYSKVNKTSYKLKENDIEQTFNIHSSYKQQLKAYQKRHFDPFSRGDRIPYFMDNSCIITTIGQLNFFRWFISKKIYNYMLINHDIIENDMNNKNKLDKKKVKKNTNTNVNIKNSKKYKNQTKICCNNYKPNITNTSNIYNTPYISRIHNMSNMSKSYDMITEPKKDKIIVSFSF